MFNFASVLVDVGTNPFGVHDPTLVDRSLNGSVVGFSFPASDESAPGQTTPQLVIETNALQYADGFVSAQDGTASLWSSDVPFGGSRALVVGPVRNRLDSRPSDFCAGFVWKSCSGAKRENTSTPNLAGLASLISAFPYKRQRRLLSRLYRFMMSIWPEVSSRPAPSVVSRA